MNKRAFCDVLSRRLNVRRGRLVSLVQRLSEAGQIRTNHSRLPDFAVSPVEAARMLLVGLVDEGLAAAPDTIRRFGGLIGRSSTLEQALGHALARPKMMAPSRSGMELHVGDSPYVAMTTVSADGVTTQVYGSMPAVESDGIDRIITVSGGALFAIAHEIAGLSEANVNALLEGAKPTASAAN
jgi:hypothetical protein